ncbi:MAG TPA: NADPH-dependent FMN reductase [Frankiaceae bacterium]|jgi:NAD(P)H-dependent FMN reductase|nr:NADPH-dependent FMN reductase [Frankiaceae bacterium]
MATQILLICGSTRRGSTNRSTLDTAAAVAPVNVMASVYDVMTSLPHFNPDLDELPLPEPVAQLRRAVESAHAVLFCTPEYAGALPGSLKNLLDWTVGGVEISAKPCGWVNISTRPNGAVGAHAELATVLRYTDARLVDAACVRIPVGRADIGTDGLITSPQTREALTGVLAALADAASGTSPAQTM